MGSSHQTGASGTQQDCSVAKTTMTRPRGRAPKGERLLASVPHGHWKTTTFLAALRTTGLTAPLVVDGAINGEIFLGWVSEPDRARLLEVQVAPEDRGMGTPFDDCRASVENPR